MAASSYEANDSEGRRGGGAVDDGSDRARANRTMSADINMSNRLNHLVRAEEAELQQLGIIDSDSPRYAHDINRTGGGIGGQGKSALAREDPNAGHPAGPRWMDSPNGKQPASASPAANRTSLSGLHSSLTSMFGSATGIRQFLKTPVTTPAFVKCRLIREKVRRKHAHARARSLARARRRAVSRMAVSVNPHTHVHRCDDGGNECSPRQLTR